MDTEADDNREATPTPEGEDDPVEAVLVAACGLVEALCGFNTAAKVAFPGYTPTDLLAELAEDGYGGDPFGSLFALLVSGGSEIAIAKCQKPDEWIARPPR
jgi:hypothetical protein